MQVGALGGSFGEPNVFHLATYGGPQKKIMGLDVLVRGRKRDPSNHKTICWRIKTPTRGSDVVGGLKTSFSSQKTHLWD